MTERVRVSSGHRGGRTKNFAPLVDKEEGELSSEEGEVDKERHSASKTREKQRAG